MQSANFIFILILFTTTIFIIIVIYRKLKFILLPKGEIIDTSRSNRKHK